MFKTRVIVGGPPRSGTTLVRWLMDSAGLISGAETSFFIRPIEAQRRSVAIERISNALGLPADFVAETVGAFDDSVDCYDALMAEVARLDGREPLGWSEKTPNNCFEYGRLSRDKRLRFVSMVRHGLDVVTSRIEGRDHYHCSIDLYVDSIKAVAEFKSPRHVVVAYEDLVSDPITTMTHLFEWLEIDFDAQSLSRARTQSRTRDLTKVHQPKVIRPVQPTWVGRWRDPEHRDRIAAFVERPDAVAALKQFGYSCR